MTQTAQTPPTGWENILRDDEIILWQGTPQPGINPTPKMIVPAIFGLFFAGFAVVWMIVASRAGGIFWMFGLLHFFAGLGLAFGSLLGPAITARRTWYTLTTQRAYIAKKSIWGSRQLQSYPITKDTPISTEMRRYMTINFASETKRRSKGGITTNQIGFRDLVDGEAVFKLISDIQKDAP